MPPGPQLLIGMRRTEGTPKVSACDLNHTLGMSRLHDKKADRHGEREREREREKQRDIDVNIDRRIDSSTNKSIDKIDLSFQK